ncbi:MAG: DUF5318 family protein [Microbispora sp.]|nr:DUF5318 family protein [Microbispora sp.]
MCSQRSVVDHGLARRAAVRSVRAGRVRARDACDARSTLLRAARFHGEPTSRMCPICGRSNVTNVTYVYGDEPGRVVSQVKRLAGLTAGSREYRESRVSVMEVCQGCSWNNLAVSFVLGTADPPGPSL